MTDAIDKELRALLEADAIARSTNERYFAKVSEGLERFGVDAMFHARVHTVARILMNDRDFKEIGDHELSLGLALKAVVAVDEMRPGGILDFKDLR